MNLRRPSAQSRTGSADSTPDLYQNWRENLVRPMLIGALIFGLLALIPALVSAENYFLDGVFIGAYLILIIVTVVRFPYWLRIGAFLFVVYALGVSELFASGILGDGMFFFLGLIVMATMMLSPRAGMAATAICLITYAVMGWLTLSGTITLLYSDAMRSILADWLVAAATLLLFGGVIILGLRRLQLEFVDAQKRTDKALHDLEFERGALEEHIAERTLQLKAVNEVGRVASSILNPDELVSRIVNLITDQFGYYYSAIFLLDTTGEWAELHSATGEAGRLLKESGHRLRVGSASMVGTAASIGEARIAQNVGAEAVRFENPLLPYTRSELALPLMIGDRILGVLDVQSTQETAFGPQEVDTLQSMARQVSVALENARLFDSARKSLEEMQAIQRQYVLDAWKPLSESEELQYEVGEEPSESKAVELNVPLSLRDEIIGQVSLMGQNEWTPEQRNFIEAVATQAALALENARLVQASQSSAAREHLLAEITAKIWSSATIDGVLQAAVRELGRALEASEATIELKVEEG